MEGTLHLLFFRSGLSSSHTNVGSFSSIQTQERPGVKVTGIVVFCIGY